MPAGCVIGVDLGGTKLLAGVVDEDLNVHHRAQRRARGADEGEVLDTIVGAVREMLDASDVPIRGVGFGIPSLVDPVSGTAMSTVHLPLRGVPFRDVMAERLGVPVWVDNDANVALLAEHRAGAARGAADAVMLTLGTGIGGAIIAGGRLVRGANGGAGEFGHTTVDPAGVRCDCGNIGCLETIVSGRALGREAARAAVEAPDSRLGRAREAGREITGMLATELAHDGDPVARSVVRAMGELLGVGIANAVNVLNPSVVVIGGGVVAAGDLLLEPARDVVRARALAPSRDTVRIVPSRFGEESGMLGAALLAHDGLAGRGVAAA
jgi:glucokinase